MSEFSNNKSWLKSKTIWGGILAVVPFIWQTLDIDPIFTVEELDAVVQRGFLLVEQCVALGLIIKGRIDAAKDNRDLRLF